MLPKKEQSFDHLSMRARFRRDIGSASVPLEQWQVEKERQSILQGHPEHGQALQRLIKDHQLCLHMGQQLRVTPKERNSYKEDSSGTA